MYNDQPPEPGTSKKLKGHTKGTKIIGFPIPYARGYTRVNLRRGGAKVPQGWERYSSIAPPGMSPRDRTPRS